MKRVRTSIAGVLLLVLAALPLPGCMGGPGAGMGSMARVLMSVGASVGTYLLVKELN